MILLFYLPFIAFAIYALNKQGSDQLLTSVFVLIIGLIIAIFMTISTLSAIMGEGIVVLFGVAETVTTGRTTIFDNMKPDPNLDIRLFLQIIGDIALLIMLLVNLVKWFKLRRPNSSTVNHEVVKQSMLREEIEEDAKAYRNLPL